MRVTKLILAALIAIAPFTALQAFADDKADVMALATKFDNSFNAGDSKTAVALCAPHAIIIDDFAPFVWQGSNTCEDWLNALVAYDKKMGIANEKVTLGKPWHLTVTGDRAYIVLPTTYTYTQKGKPVTESGAAWTMAMQKSSAGWLITGWSWAQH
jgi:hypothetical protein